MTNLPEPEPVYTIFSDCMDCARAFDSGVDRGLGGRLVLYSVLKLDGSAIALAASIAGAASLGIDPDAERLKQAVRNGVCDFMVNTLDEALRILKNEVRKKQPVAVGLTGDVAACVAAIVERGVQPDLLAFAAGAKGIEGDIPVDLAELVRRGARRLFHDGQDASSLEAVRWTVADSPARWLPKLDALAAEALSPGNAAGERLRWLRLAPRYFPRAPYHFLRMTSSEAEQFLEAVRGKIPSITTAVTVERKTAAGLESVATLAGDGFS